MPTNKELFKAAKALAELGQPVFPCRSLPEDTPAGFRDSKSPLTRRGVLDASTDVEKLRRWWKAKPGAAIGLATGFLWDVLDVDVKAKEDGRVHLPRLRDLGLLNGCQRLVETPSGGYHLYFTANKSNTNRASATLGLDVRGMGGYVLAAPSYIETDDYEGSYVELEAPTGANTEPLYWDLIKSALLPVNNNDSKKVVALLPSDRQSSVAALREWVANSQPGERNNCLHWAVCRCIENNIDPHELVDAAVLAGLNEDEVLLTVTSAIRRAGKSVNELDSEADAMFPDLP